VSICRVGFASADMTPKPGIDLYSLESEFRNSDNVQDPLLASTLCIQDATGSFALIISADIIWLSPAICHSVRSRLHAQLGIPPEFVFLCATHTHASPQVLKLSRNPARRDPGYENALVEALVDSALRAYGSMTPGSLHLASAHCPVAVYRRKSMPDPNALKRLRWKMFIANRPVPGHPIDDLLTVLRVDDASGRPRAMLLNLACHPTLFRGNAVSADYPGQIRRHLCERFGAGFETIFLQGYGGNLKPAIFRRAPLSLRYPIRSLYSLLFDRLHFNKALGTDELKAFAKRILDCLDQAVFREIRPGALGAARVNAELPLANLSDKIFMGIHVLQLAPELALVGLEGEVFMEYGLWLRGKVPGALPVGCCGGVVGYIPDEYGLSLGGYEVDRSLDDFGLNGRFAPGVEMLVKAGIVSALNVAGHKCQ